MQKNNYLRGIRQFCLATNTRSIISCLIPAFFLAIDRIFKSVAVAFPQNSFYLIKNLIGWEYFANSGIAFNIPVPQNFLIITLFVIIFGLFFVLAKKCKDAFFSLALSLIIIGASSNLVDRIFYGFVIDYFRIFTSVVNVADIMILVGVILIIVKTSGRHISSQKTN